MTKVVKNGKARLKQKTTTVRKSDDDPAAENKTPGSLHIYTNYRIFMQARLLSIGAALSICL